MIKASDIGTYLIITAVAAMIWYWAAAETRNERTLQMRINFKIAAEEPDHWRVEPRAASISITVEGSQLAIRKASEIRELDIDIPSTHGAQTITLATVLGNHPLIKNTGVTLLSVEPALSEIQVDEIVPIAARVRRFLPDIQTTGDVIVEPANVTIRMPSTLRAQYPGNLTVDLLVDPSELLSLTPGVSQTIQADLRLPQWLRNHTDVQVEPARVSVSFTIRSQIESLTLETPVQVQIAGPDTAEYMVAPDPQTLRNVTIEAPVELIRQIREREAIVLAIVHVRYSEMEQAITAKPVTYFVAIKPDGSGVTLNARVGDATDPPMIGLTITERPNGAAPP